MTRFSFLHAADIHLDSPLRGLSRYEGVPAEAIRAAPRQAFDRLIAAAIDRRVNFVVIAGDLYDGDWKDAGTGLYFAAAMGKLAREGIPAYLIDGNHDAASIISRELPSPAGLHRFPSTKAHTHHLPGLGVAIHGRSFGARAETENLAAGYPPAVRGAFNIGVLHTSLSGGYDGHEPYAPCTPAELAAKGYQYWALGHVHEHDIVSSSPHIVYPGNLQGRTIREAGPRGAMLVEVEDGEVCGLTRLALDVVRWGRVEVDASDAAELAELHRRIAASLRLACEAAEDRPLIVRMTIAGRTSLHGALQDVMRTLRDEVRSLAAELSDTLWIEKLHVRTTHPAAHAPAAEPDGIAALIPVPDDALAAKLQKDMAKFLASVSSPGQDGLLGQAASGDWTEIMRIASAALRHRLGAAG